MATVLSVETVRATSKRVTWQWVDAFGTVYGPQVNHIPVGDDAQAFANAKEAEQLAAIAQAELDANMNEIAGNGA